MQNIPKKHICLALIMSAVFFFSCKRKNHSPDTPITPSGTSSGHTGASYLFSTKTTDPDGDSVSYQFNWGNGDTSDWSNFYQIGLYVAMSKSWASTGIYWITARARDEKLLLSDWSPGCSINISPNHPPNNPLIPTGPFGGAIDSIYTFSVSTIDPDDDSVSYLFDWGNGDTSDWSDFVLSNQSVTLSKSWSTFGTYYVKVRAKDNLGAISDWSDSLPVAIRLNWYYKTDDNINSSPAIGSDGTIYFGSYDDYLYALNPDGSLKWRYLTGGDIYSSPAIGTDGTIYFGSKDSFFYALNSDGSLKWSYQTEGEVRSSPAIGTDGTIYFGSYDSSFYALNPDGSLIWHYQTNGRIRSSPAINSNGTIYFGSYDGNLYAMNPDGTLKWRYLTGSAISSSPAIGIDGTIYFGSYDNYLYALNPDSTLKWRYQTDIAITSSPAIGLDGAIYFSSDNKIYAVNADGSLRWRDYSFMASSFTIASDGTIYVGSSNSIDRFGLFAYDPEGNLKWLYPAGYVHTVPAIYNDGMIFFGSSNDNFYAIHGSGPLANTPWPKFRHDLRNTGRFGGP